MMIKQQSCFYCNILLYQPLCPTSLTETNDGQFRVRKWTELNNVRQYYNFFRQHKDEFER